VSDPAWLTIAEKHLGFHETGNNQGIEEFIASAHTGSVGERLLAAMIVAGLMKAEMFLGNGKPGGITHGLSSYSP